MRKKEPLIKLSDAIRAFCEDGTWLERQGVYTLTLAEAKQRAVDIIKSVLAKTEPTISKMEQVDKDINVRSKDEPQAGEMMTEEEFDSMLARVLTGKDEPQTDCPQSAICGKPCKECGACEKECGMWDILKTEQTERSE